MWKCTYLVAVALPALFGALLQADEPKTAKPPIFQTPKGWEKLDPKAPGIVTAQFRIGEGETQVTVTLTRAGGGLAANVNRWRSQLGLEALAEDNALKTLQPTKVDGMPGHVLDITGSKVEGKAKERIVVVAVPSGEQAWFVRMSGPAGSVAEQKAAFDEFVKSFRFEK